MPERLRKQEAPPEAEKRDPEEHEELVPEESGVRKRPTPREHAEESEHRQRLIVGSTRQIIKLIKEERDLLQRIQNNEEELRGLESELAKLNPGGVLGLLKRLANQSHADALQEEISEVKKSLGPLKREYLDSYVRVAKGGQKFGEGRSWEERLKRAEEKLAKQERILDVSKRALNKISKNAPEQEPASGR